MAGHILDSDDRALLQGFPEPPKWQPGLTETRKKAYVAQCIPCPFGTVVSEAVFSYRRACVEAEKIDAKLAGLGAMSDEAAFDLVCALANERSGNTKETIISKEVWAKKGSDSSGKLEEICANGVIDLGHHGVWICYGEELGWAPREMNMQLQRASLGRMPWLRCDTPPSIEESPGEFRGRREREKWLLHNVFFEGKSMAAEDSDATFNTTRGAAKSRAKAFSDRMFMNVQPRPDELARYDSNAELQKSEPLWHGPYLDEGQKYHTPRTPENVKKAGGDMGLCELSSQLAGEESHYRDLVYECWIIFDGLLRAIKGVEINADSTGVKPYRTQPYRWSPAKVAAGKLLIEGFVKDGS